MSGIVELKDKLVTKYSQLITEKAHPTVTPFLNNRRLHMRDTLAGSISDYTKTIKRRGWCQR
jgi:hypothetical protein